MQRRLTVGKFFLPARVSCRYTLHVREGAGKEERGGKDFAVFEL